MFAPIDAPNEARCLVHEAGYRTSPCSSPRPVPTERGFELQGAVLNVPCEGAAFTNYLLEVTTDGAVSELQELGDEGGCAVPGRRPAGLLSTQAPAVADGLGAHFARASRDEAASIAAFLQLASELERLGAPASAVREARRAAGDELRHAELMGRLATRFGARAQCATVRAQPPRGLAALALSNAVEGCVNESFAALSACHQAAFSSDPGVRRTLHSIARDELRHAAWSWAVATWAEPQLRTCERRSVQAARRRAFECLADQGVAHSESLGEVAGLPSRRVRLAVVDALRSLA